MKNLFDQPAYDEILQRLQKLTPQSQRLWGKMTVAQMLAHCKVAFSVPLSEKKMPRMFLGLLLGWTIKSKLYNESPWKKNLPTAPNFIIRDERDFEIEKAALIDLINQFHKGGPGNVGKFPHPMFGRFNPEQWGKSMYKHLDHHLQQFGV